MNFPFFVCGIKVMDVPNVVTATREMLKALRTKDWVHYETLCKSVGRIRRLRSTESRIIKFMNYASSYAERNQDSEVSRV